MKTREEMRTMLAGMAMQGLCANANAQIPATSYAESAVSFADALLAELDRTAPKPEAPIPDADGWIPHRPGDPMPCDEYSKVAVRFIDGVEDEGNRAGLWRGVAGSRSFWDRHGEETIIAWKPAK